jgi:hypothetical protein
MDPVEGMRVSRCMGGRRAAGHDRRSQADCPAHFGVIPGDPARRADNSSGWGRFDPHFMIAPPQLIVVTGKRMLASRSGFWRWLRTLLG